MKKFALLFVTAIVILTSCAPAHYTVRTAPPPPRVMVRPAAPSYRHVWVGDNYVWNRGRYVHQPGYWAVPRGNKHNYVNGHWVTVNRGYQWSPGYWR